MSPSRMKNRQRLAPSMSFAVITWFKLAAFGCYLLYHHSNFEATLRDEISAGQFPTLVRRQGRNRYGSVRKPERFLERSHQQFFTALKALRPALCESPKMITQGG